LSNWIRQPTDDSSNSVLNWDARLLQDALLKAISSSPDSFLTTIREITNADTLRWVSEVRSSTWVIAQRDGNVVGVVGAKRPNAEDRESPETSRYIESVWIAPDLRGHHLAERLIKYLLYSEYRRYPRINQFQLWVFDTNLPAIKLYRNLRFTETPERNEGVRTEIKYRLDFSDEVCADVCRAVTEDALRRDELRHGVTYRVLGGEGPA